MPRRVKMPVCSATSNGVPTCMPAAEAAVFPFRVLADADHVDVFGRAVGERRRHARQQPHRPQVHVLVEALAQRQDQLPDGHVVGHARIADRAEEDRLELLQLLEAVRVHHPAVADVEVAAPRETPSSPTRPAPPRSITSSAAGMTS